MATFAGIVGQELESLAPGVMESLRADLCGTILPLHPKDGPWVNIADTEDYRSFQHVDPHDKNLTTLVWTTCPKVCVVRV